MYALHVSVLADKKFWSDIGNDLLRRKLNTERQYGLAKNVILFLGDGMSIATMTAARIYMGQLANKTGESEMLSFEKFPFTGLSKVSLNRPEHIMRISDARPRPRK